MTVEELLKDKLEEYYYDEDTIMVTTAFLDMFAKEFAKEKCKELLEIVAEKVVATVAFSPGQPVRGYVKKDSILNAVDLDSFII